MPKEDLIKLAEALASIEYKLEALKWELIKLEIIERGRTKEATEASNPVS